MAFRVPVGAGRVVLAVKGLLVGRYWEMGWEYDCLPPSAVGTV